MVIPSRRLMSILQRLVGKEIAGGRKPAPHGERGIEMSIHDITILLGIYVATIGAGALVGCVIDRMRK